MMDMYIQGTKKYLFQEDMIMRALLFHHKITLKTQNLKHLIF